MTSFPAGQHHSAGTNHVSHSKEDALDDREFELLFEGASRMRDYYDDQAAFVILVLGRLGLRRGELAHLREDWIDWRHEMIQIPLHQDCHGERDGNGICGSCRQLAKQKSKRNDDLAIEQAVDNQWCAKTPAAARDVYFGFDARVKMHISRFFEEFDAWPWAPASINRRVKKAAEHADELTRDDVFPHSLRATAATRLAAQGLGSQALTQHFGWAKIDTADVYLARNGQNTARQLDAIHQG